MRLFAHITVFPVRLHFYPLFLTVFRLYMFKYIWIGLFLKMLSAAPVGKVGKCKMCPERREAEVEKD